MSTPEIRTDKLGTNEDARDATTVVITFPTEDAAERFTYLAGQLAQLTTAQQMRLLPLAVAIRDFLRLATDIAKIRAERREGTRNDL